MKMKHFGVGILLLSAMVFMATGCFAGQSSSEGVTMSGEKHKKAFPKGHDRSKGKNCYYDSELDVFLCPFETGTSPKGVTMSEKKHKEMFPRGHDRSKGKNCFYDSEHDVFLCALGNEPRVRTPGVTMSGEKHKKMFPHGHDRSKGKNCYYDETNDVFLCPFEGK